MSEQEGNAIIKRIKIVVLIKLLLSYIKHAMMQPNIPKHHCGGEASTDGQANLDIGGETSQALY